MTTEMRVNKTIRIEPVLFDYITFVKTKMDLPYISDVLEMSIQILEKNLASDPGTYEKGSMIPLKSKSDKVCRINKTIRISTAAYDFLVVTKQEHKEKSASDVIEVALIHFQHEHKELTKRFIDAFID